MFKEKEHTVPCLNEKAKMMTIKAIVFFTITTFVGSALLDYPIFGEGIISDGFWGLIMVCWVPALAGLLTMAFWKMSFLDMLGLKMPQTKFLLWGIAAPLTYATAAYGGAIMLGGCQFAWSQPFVLGSLATDFLLRLVRVTGEELGWRGFLFPALRKVGSFRQASMILGVIWSLWHFAAIIFGNYNNGGTAWYVLFFFTVMILGHNFVICWLREKSGSLWPGVLLHAVHNLYIQKVLDPRVIPDHFTKFVTSEWGCGLAITCTLVLLVLWPSTGKGTMQIMT